MKFAEVRDFVTSFSYPDNLFGVWGSAPSEAGVTVNELTAMQSAAVVGCVRIIASLLASQPINVEEVDPVTGAKTVAFDHTVQYLLNVLPNPETDAYIFRETLQIHLLLTGNAYMEKRYDNGGRLAALYQRSPFRTWPYRLEKDALVRTQFGIEEVPKGTLIYKTTDGSERGSSMERIILAENMIHIKKLSLDGIVGMNPIKSMAREIVGLDIAARAFGARLFANDASPSGLLTTDKLLKDDKRKKLEDSWRSGHGGANAHKFAVLDGGLKWEKISLSPEESQFLLTRGYQRNEIATCIYGVPPHLIGDREESSRNTEQQMLQFLNFTLKPWMRCWESSLNAKLLPDIGRNAGRFRLRYDTQELERGDFESMLKAISVGRQWGIYTGNEGRRLLGLNPYEEHDTDTPADKLWQPVNVGVAGDDHPLSPQNLQGTNEGNGAEGGGSSTERAAQVYWKVFRDAFGRALTRDKADIKSLTATFGPAFYGLSDYLYMCADPDFRAGNVLPDGIVEFVVDYIGGMSKRRGDWTKENIDQQAREELLRAATAINTVVLREISLREKK